MREKKEFPLVLRTSNFFIFNTHSKCENLHREKHREQEVKPLKKNIFFASFSSKRKAASGE
jgi:hypothetical protein